MFVCKGFVMSSFCLYRVCLSRICYSTRGLSGQLFYDICFVFLFWQGKGNNFSQKNLWDTLELEIRGFFRGRKRGRGGVMSLYLWEGVVPHQVREKVYRGNRANWGLGLWKRDRECERQSSPTSYNNGRKLSINGEREWERDKERERER